MTHEDWTACARLRAPDLFARVRAFAEIYETQRPLAERLFRVVQLGPAGPRAWVVHPVGGRAVPVDMFASNAYLGLSTHPRVVEAMRAAAGEWGLGTGAVSLYAGTTVLHRRLEEVIASHYGCEEAILFPNGYAANVGVLSALLAPGDRVYSDVFNHASIHDGCRLSGATVVAYGHNDVVRLRTRLMRDASSDVGRLIVTDGVFSMDGDLAPLGDIVPLARAAGARLMIDEAHALGVVGPGGRGTAAACGVADRIDITLGTLSKAPSAVGGYVCGDRALIDYLRHFARTYFFSTSLPAPVVAGLIAWFAVLAEEPEHHRRLWDNIALVTGALRAAGFDPGATASAIVPVLLGDETRARHIAADLLDEGICVNLVAYPAVPRRRARLRIGVQCGHSVEQIDRLVVTLERIARRRGWRPDGECWGTVA